MKGAGAGTGWTRVGAAAVAAAATKADVSRSATLPIVATRRTLGRVWWWPLAVGGCGRSTGIGILGSKIARWKGAEMMGCEINEGDTDRERASLKCTKIKLWLNHHNVPRPLH